MFNRYSTIVHYINRFSILMKFKVYTIKALEKLVLHEFELTRIKINFSLYSVYLCFFAWHILYCRFYAEVHNFYLK